MLKSILPLSFIIATRFFGLFIVLPVLSLYALELQGANEFLTGLLIGIYALMQMLFQVPFGVLSDKIGRKKALCLGLVVFIIGSAVCAVANDIWLMMIGRALQGSGAVGAVATAMISDFVKEEQRSKAMAIMGACIGLAFALMSLAFELGVYSVGIFIAGVVVFFVGFNLHEPIMQSVASKFALANERGAALGVFNAFGYGGSFLGGLVSGLAWEFLSMLELTVVLLIIICAWFVLLCFLKSPSDFKNLYLALDTKLDTNALSSHKGIVEIYTNSTQLVIKYDSKIIDEKVLKGLLRLV